MAGNLLPILLLGGAAAVVLKKKKKKQTTFSDTEAPEAPEELPFPTGEDEGAISGEEAPGEPGLSTGTYEGPEPGKAVASGVERYYTGAYPWKILFTLEGDYAAHYYPMGHMGPHEEVARGDTVEDAIKAFQFWATNEDRRKRNLPPLLIAKAVESANAPKQAELSDLGD